MPAEAGVHIDCVVPAQAGTSLSTGEEIEIAAFAAMTNLIYELLRYARN